MAIVEYKGTLFGPHAYAYLSKIEVLPNSEYVTFTLVGKGEALYRNVAGLSDRQFELFEVNISDTLGFEVLKRNRSEDKLISTFYTIEDGVITKLKSK